MGFNSEFKGLNMIGKLRNNLIANMALICNPHYLSACCTSTVISNICKEHRAFIFYPTGYMNFQPTTQNAMSRANKSCHKIRVNHTTAICILKKLNAF
jgi:hypothetical protein